jgi:hypothetical protein
MDPLAQMSRWAWSLVDQRKLAQRDIAWIDVHPSRALTRQHLFQLVGSALDVL